MHSTIIASITFLLASLILVVRGVNAESQPVVWVTEIVTVTDCDCPTPGPFPTKPTSSICSDSSSKPWPPRPTPPSPWPWPSCSDITKTSTGTTTLTEPPTTTFETDTITAAPSTVTDYVTTTISSTTTTTEPPCMFPPATLDLGTCKYAPRVHLGSNGAVITYVDAHFYWLSDIARVLDFVCGDLETRCGAPEATLQKCQEAKTEALQYEGKEAVEVFNQIIAPCS